LKRIRRIASLRSQGLSSPQIGKRLGIAPSTVRDYERDPFRKKARRRQLRYGVEGVSMPAGGTPIESVKAHWKSGAPAKGKGVAANLKRGRQMRAVIGSYSHR
jgi:hypothetical protein